MSRVRIREDHKQLLAGLYERTAKTLDELPYTEEFERLFASFLQKTGLNISRHEVWHLLAGQRKAAKLARMKRPPADRVE